MNEATRRDWLQQAQARWDARAEAWSVRAAANAAAADRPADLDRIWSALALRPGAQVLDAGCGSGQFALALAARGVRVIGVDLSPEMIRLAENSANRENAPSPVRWAVGSVDALHLADASVDAVHARMVLPFVPDVPAALREFRRILRPGGRLLASTAGALSPIYRESWRRHLSGSESCNYLLPWELEPLLATAGWRLRDEWGEWGEDVRGNPNLAVTGAVVDRRLQQATATTWTIIAE
ncbi:MAG: class I SAM-dependent methyltransferase [Thermomicrobiales bacterium]|nr:class I SAM-dependent methyltransferase [Thermomicrobiales bacterium]